MYDQTDYRPILKQELEKRCRKNGRYSLRAFARDLGMSSARLSEVLNAKTGLSRENAERIAGRLGFSEDEKEFFSNLVESVHARSQIKKELARARLAKYQLAQYRSIELSHFEVLSNWYHLAILELLDIKGSKNDPRWIANALGIQEIEAKLALERLERLGYLRRSGKRLVPTHERIAVSSPIPSEAIRNFHRQVLQKALESVDTQSVEKRELGATILPINRADLPRLKEMVRAFRKQLNQEASLAANKDSVYCLATQLFELSDLRPKGKK